MKQHFRLALSRREYKRGKGGIRQAIDVSARIEQNLGELCFAVDSSNAKRLYIGGGRASERAKERERASEGERERERESEGEREREKEL